MRLERGKIAPLFDNSRHARGSKIVLAIEDPQGMTDGLRVARMPGSVPPGRNQAVLIFGSGLGCKKTIVVFHRLPGRDKIVREVVVEQQRPIIAGQQTAVRIATNAAGLLDQVFVSIDEGRLLLNCPNLPAYQHRRTPLFQQDFWNP